MTQKKTTAFIAGILFFASLKLCALPAINLIRPYNSNFKPELHQGQHFFLWNIPMYGFSAHGWNAVGDKVNSLQYLNPEQNSLAMVKGFAPGTPEAAIAQQFNINADDGVRGRFKVTGTFDVPFSYNLGAQYHFDNHMWVGAFIPFYKMSLKNVVWKDQTKNLNAADALAHNLITDNLFTLVDVLGDGLKLEGWTKSGPGDLTCYIGYRRKVEQQKKWLKHVEVNVRGAFMLPTGVKEDENRIMSFPFGNDGSVGGILGGGLDLDFLERLNLGIDVQFLQVFNNTRERRIKVNNDQTDFLLLQKTAVQKEFGFFQKFNLYVEPKLFKRASLLVAYVHMKNGKDHFYVVSNDFSSTIANTAESLEAWSTHNVFLQFKLDAGSRGKGKFKPQLSLFYQHPFNGKNSVQEDMFGVSCILNF